jgi:ribosomal protein S18 acetylase RimI-like enzyme
VIRPATPADKAAILHVAVDTGPNRVYNLPFLAAAKAAQGPGTGSALVHHVEAMLQAHDQRMLLIETSGVDGFHATRRFYTALAYAEVARVPDFFGDGDDKVIFAKRL